MRVSHPLYGMGTIDRLTTGGLGAWVRWDNTPNTTHHHMMSYLTILYVDADPKGQSMN